MGMIDLSDDLKSNFRSWEVDCDEKRYADELYCILVKRHPSIDLDIIKKEAYHWVGCELNKDI